MHSINLLFNAKILFWKIFVWVKNFTFLLLPSEKASHKNGIYKNCILNFLTEKCFFFLLVQSKFLFPKQEKRSERIRWHHFSKVSEMCMSSIFHRLSLSNCMTNSLGLWHHFSKMSEMCMSSIFHRLSLSNCMTNSLGQPGYRLPLTWGKRTNNLKNQNFPSRTVEPVIT